MSYAMLTRDQALGIYEAGPDAVVEALLEMDGRISSLEDQLAKNSRNSSKPSSTDGFRKPAPKSLRSRGERPVGGQPGHPGHTLKMVANPAKTVVHPVNSCAVCGNDLQGEEPSGVEKRQVFDLPPIVLEVTEHQAETKVCAHCGTINKAAFPEGVNAPVQYGPRLQATAVYLKDYQLLPYQRTAEMMEDLFDCPVSEGTVVQITQDYSQLLDEPLEQIKQVVTAAPVASFDETGCSVEGKRQWLHVASTPEATYFGVHPTRGAEATDEIGILPHFTGRAIHDFWPPYFTYTCDHGLCNAHHLRELTFVHEQYDQPWAKDMIDCLLDMKAAVEEAKVDSDHIPEEQRADFETRYQQILDTGYALNPLPADPTTGPKKRGRRKKTRTINLLERLDKHREEVWAFVDDFNVPFDNNLAERDVRMMKVQQKISGTFRSTDGAKDFCRIRSYISTARKNAHSAIDAIVLALNGTPFVPILDST